MLTAELESAIAQRFADNVMRLAQLPRWRRSDIERAAEIALASGEVRLTCLITGSTYAATWDGSDATALGLAEEAAAGTA